MNVTAAYAITTFNALTTAQQALAVNNGGESIRSEVVSINTL